MGKIKHNLCKNKVYYIFYSMKQRCYNPNNKSYKNYGNRGIKICDEWLSNFINFYNWAMDNGYKEGLSIDRIDNNKSYSPENCRWTNRKIQNLNKRNNKYLTFNNKTMTISEWEKELNLKSDRIGYRLRYGWSIERALTEKVHTENINKRFI